MSTNKDDPRVKPARLYIDEHLVKAVQSLDHDGWVALKKAVDKWWQCEVCHGHGHRTESSWTKDGGGISWPTCTSCGGIGLRTREAQTTRTDRTGVSSTDCGSVHAGSNPAPPTTPRRESPRPLLPKTMSARLELLLDLYAPIGHDGQRHPGDGVLSAEQFAKLFDAPESVPEGSK